MCAVPPTGSDAEREFRELRIRAYGPDADIHGDPAALARLAELEVAHALVSRAAPSEVPPASGIVSTPLPGARPGPAHSAMDSVSVSVSVPVPVPTVDPRQTLWQRATTTRWGRLRLIGGPLVGILGLAWAVSGALAVHPETTSPPADAEPESIVYPVSQYAGNGTFDPSTVRGFESVSDPASGGAASP